MWATAIAWLAGTKAGRTVALVTVAAIAVAVSWYGFSTHYYNAGVTACQHGRATDTNVANVAQGERIVLLGDLLLRCFSACIERIACRQQYQRGGERSGGEDQSKD